jgi:hypothetical protein
MYIVTCSYDLFAKIQPFTVHANRVSKIIILHTNSLVLMEVGWNHVLYTSSEVGLLPNKHHC